MNESEFDREASQLLRNIGLVDTDTLNFFQSEHHGSEWKSSIKVPSPKARRHSSMITHKQRRLHSDRKQGQERHQNGTTSQRKEREVSEKISKSPKHTSSNSSGNTSTSGQTSRRMGGPDGRFGFARSTSSSSVLQTTDINQGQSDATIPKRAIARPAPKPPSQTATAAASRKVSPTSHTTFQTRPAPSSNKHTSGAGAPVVVNGNHVSLHPKGSMPSTAATPFNSKNTVTQALTQQNGFHTHGAIDGNKMTKTSKQASTPNKLKPKEQLQRRSSAPDQTGQQSNTQVVHSKPSSFQVLSISSSSHRILHTSEDGGATKRRPSLRKGYETKVLPAANNPQTQPSRVAHFSQASLGTKNSSSTTEGSSKPSHNETPQLVSAANTSGTYDSLSPPMSPVDPLQNPPLNKQLTKQQDGVLKLSEIQSLSGAYDRLSPVELAAIRQESEKLAQQEMAQSRSNPVRQTQQEMAQSRSNPVRQTQQEVTQSRSNPVRQTQQEVAQSRSNPVRQTQQEVTQSRSNPVRQTQQEVTQSRSNPVRQTQQEVTQSRSIPVRQTQQSVSRQASNASSSSDTSQSHSEERDNATSRRPYAAPSHRHKPLTSSKSGKNTNGTSYIPVTSPESDTSTATKGVKRHMRRHSSEDKNLKKTFSSTSAISQRPTRSTESHERNLYSPSSSSTNTLSSPEPSSDCPTPDSDERRAQLDMHWSRQSLDRDMNAVAVTTVEALSTLIEVITPVASPMKTGHHFKYDDTPPVNPNWYDENDSDSSSFPLSPLSVDIPTTSSSEPTTSPPVQSPLSGSVGVSMLPTVSQAHRLSDTTMDTGILQDEATKMPTEVEPVSAAGNIDTSASVTQQDYPKVDVKLTTNAVTSMQSETKRTSKLESIQEATSSSEAVNKAKSVTFFGQKDEEEFKSRERTSNKDSEKTKASSTKTDTRVFQNSTFSESSATKDNSPRLSQAKSVTHDYAVIDPLDHDYAILDPEYHHEFFGYCHRCTEPVIGMENGCSALDSVYHTKCFTCSKCSTPLSGKKFYTSGNQIFCETDYWSTMETCYLCSLRIRDRVLRALDQSYHPDCFRCTTCSTCLDGVPYVSDDSNDVYCIPDYHKKYAPRCAACEEPIVPEKGNRKSLRVRAMDKSYHVECYMCENCGKQLASKSGGGEKCFPLQGHLLCKTCNATKHQSMAHNVIGTAL